MKKLTKILLFSAPVFAVAAAIRAIVKNFDFSEFDFENTGESVDHSDSIDDKDDVEPERKTYYVESLKESVGQDGYKRFRCTVRNNDGLRAYRPSVKTDNEEDAKVKLKERIAIKYPNAEIVYDF